MIRSILNLSATGLAMTLAFPVVTGSFAEQSGFELIDGIDGVPRSIIIIAVDTLRSDRLGCYGNPSGITPNIDALAADGVVFERHLAPASWSLPCYASLFTGAAPSRHGVLDHSQFLPEEFHTLAELLQLYGFQTAGFVGGSHLTSIFNLHQGFEIWEDEPNFGSFFHSVPRAIDFLANREVDCPPCPKYDGPFLLMVQGYDCHTPYFTPLGLGERFDPDYTGPVHDRNLLTFENLHLIRDQRLYENRKVPVATQPRRMPIDTPALPMSARDIDHIRAHYDGAVAYADLWVGILLDHLRETGLYDKSLIVLLGDHGEDLMEHGFFFHRNALYRQNIQTPLILKFPDNRYQGRHVRQAVSTIDVFPTLLSILGISEPANQVDGQDLGFLLVDEGTDPRPIFSTLTDQESIVDDRWHLIRRTGESRRYDPRVELYDLHADPEEQSDLAEKETAIVARLEALLDEWRESQPKPSTGGTVRLDELLERTLKEGGYWEAEQ